MASRDPIDRGTVPLSDDQHTEKGPLPMRTEMDTTQAHTLSLGDLRDALKKTDAQIAAHESYQVELGAAAERAKGAAANAATKYKNQRTIENMLDALLRADMATDALDAVTNAESTLLALRKRHRELTRAIYIKENAIDGFGFSPWAAMGGEE